MEGNGKKMKKDINQRDVENFPDWKIKNKEYLTELQLFIDKADNIKNEELKNDIIKQMLKCDKILTKIAEEKIEQRGIKKDNK